MPPRKSEATSSRDDTLDETNTSTTIEDLTLPKSIITRLAKGVLPPNTQIQGNAILAMSKSATLFINYLASHANEHTITAGKKTIAPTDVFKALEDIEFSFLKEPLEAEFALFKHLQTEKRTSYRQKVRARTEGGTGEEDSEMADFTEAGATTTGSGEQGGGAAAAGVEASPRAAKKQKLDATRREGGHADQGAETTEEDEVDVRDEEDEDDDDDDDDEVEEEEDEDEEREEEDSDDDDTGEEAVEEADEAADEALGGDESD